MVIDTGGGGGTRDVGRRILVRELAREGVLRPDVLLLSHSDRDHAFGAFGLLEATTVGALYLHEAERDGGNALIPPLLALARLRSIPVRWVTTPQRLTFGTATGDVRPVATGEARNGKQLGLEVRLGGCRFVLLGDMSENAERRWLLQRGGLPADVLKVSHHGSRTSSSPNLLATLRPRWAVVSSGQDNRYGHPVPEVMERFRRRGIELLRTDFHGAVRFRVGRDGTLECHTSEGPCGVAVCGGGPVT